MRGFSVEAPAWEQDPGCNQDGHRPALTVLEPVKRGPSIFTRVKGVPSPGLHPADEGWATSAGSQVLEAPKEVMSFSSPS